MIVAELCGTGQAFKVVMNSIEDVISQDRILYRGITVTLITN